MFFHIQGDSVHGRQWGMGAHERAGVRHPILGGVRETTENKGKMRGELVKK
ncbi:hypothetical protein I5U42_22730 [Stenotrophomonas maltophilia]|uniref:hypothetical protein n=1 Tax=Stenotrophomonas sp. RAC2 TaxID=3064902 RepID=UPI0018D377D5|nr:hypothetical protein [Stenotrophomonas sp. RAC2]MBH1434112.1 hypothetical protein [Stenotrophomonas maltophilia]MDV9042353.1 hypothetical protein [Stenotrophomonas sp. RAC2]